MIDRIINTWLDFGEMLDKKFKYGKKIFEAINIAIAMLFFIVAGGWLIAYDVMTFMLFCIFGLLVAILLACWHGWFIMLPLFVVFLGICFGRWLYLRKAKYSVCNKS